MGDDDTRISLVRRGAPAEQIAEFGRYAAACNADPSQHIGYVAEEADDVTDELTGLEGEHVYAVARDGERLCGLLCAEWDTDIGRTWLYGPWADTPGLMDRLYAAVRPLVPPGAAQHELFCDVANAAVVAFATRHGFPNQTEHVILRFSREQLADLPPVSLPLLTPELHGQFADLHDAAFPNTYAPARELLKGSQPILVAVAGDTLLGYIALKLRPEFAEAQIEYLAVAEAARGRGTGARLLTAGLHHILADDRYGKVDLVTNNPAARRLYERVGFTLLREMRAFRTS
jgi:ribosomal protein S18 acetylase RimI-like enzyme